MTTRIFRAGTTPALKAGFETKFQDIAMQVVEPHEGKSFRVDWQTDTIGA